VKWLTSFGTGIAALFARMVDASTFRPDSCDVSGGSTGLVGARRDAAYDGCS